MTLIETMKLALKALEMLARYENPETRIQVRKPKDGGPIVTMYPHKVATDAADALRTAIAQAEKQEPVAWMFTDVEGTEFFEEREDWEGKWTPLYTTPPAAPVQEPVAWIQPNHLQQARRAPFQCRVEPTKRMSDFIPIYTTPPAAQRQPLTDERIALIAAASGGLASDFVITVARAIEAAHGIGEKK